MPIKIHHGAPGSYKTAGAMADDVLPAIKEGRVIVTNVRGLSRERILEVLPETPETIDVISVDSGTREGREKLATWFHWVPLGALLVIDECQSIWPKHWKDSHLDKLAFPGGIDSAESVGRPHDWSTAWEMHRHYNWDFVLTTPSIKLVRADIRECAEVASKHRNLALIGWKGRYLEGIHPAESNGSRSDFLGEPKTRKIPKVVWGLYDSTKTGAHSDTQAFAAIWKDPKLLVALGVLALALFFGLSGGRSGNGGQTLDRLLGAAGQPVVEPAASVPRPAGRSGGAGPGDSVGVRAAGAGGGVVERERPWSQARIVVDGWQDWGTGRRYLFRLESEGGALVVSEGELQQAGYRLLFRGPCAVRLAYADGWESWALCEPKREPEEDQWRGVGTG
jgi:zona occludens toxin